jgi:hypothetical protein
MNARMPAALILFALSGQPVLAADEPRETPPQGGLLSGTPEEQAACSPDATKFCKDEIPDTFRVLACLQEHRDKLRKACQQVLKNNGQ